MNRGVRIRKLANGPWWQRALLRAAIVLAGALALYWIAANVFLRTSLGRSFLNAKPYSFLVNYESAYTIIPGRVHVEKLSIRGRSSSAEWRLVVDRGDFGVSLTELPRKRFHATWVRAEGAELRVRLRLFEKSDVVSTLPPIEGFDDPPLRDFGPEPAPMTDAQYHLWTVQLDDVDIDHVREIWIHEERGVGDSRVRGRWYFRPQRWLDIGPATVDVRSLDLTHGSDLVALGMHGSFVATIHPFDIRVPSGVETLDHLSGHADMKGFLSLSRGFGDVFHLDDVRFVHGGGPVDVHLLVDHGVIAPGTRIRNESPATEFVVGPMTFDTAVAVDLAVDASPSAEKGRAGVFTVRATDLHTSAATGARAHAASLTTILTSASDASLAFAHPYPFADADIVADANDVEPEAIEPWKAMIPAAHAIQIPSGRARVDAHLEGSLARKTAHGDARFAIDGLAVEFAGDRFTGNVEGAIVVADAAVEGKRFDLSGSWTALADTTASIHGVSVHAPRIRIDATRATFGESAPPKVEIAFDLPRADVSDLRSVGALLPRTSPVSSVFGRAHVGGKAKLELPARVLSGSATAFGERVGAQIKGITVALDLRARVAHARWAWGANDLDVHDADLVLTNVSASTQVGGKARALFAIPTVSAAAPHLSFSDKAPRGRIVASIPRVDVAQLTALAHFVPMPHDMSLDGGRATARLQADVDLGARSAAGTCTIAAHGVTVRAGSKTVTSDVRVSVNAKSGLNGDSLDFSGSNVAIDNGEAHGGPHGWWARVDLPEAAMWWKGGFHMRTVVHGRARDAEPASVLVAGETVLPEWITRVFKMTGVDATAELRAAPQSFEVRSFFARGQGSAVRMEYETQAGRGDGVMLLELGELNLGLGLAASGGSVVLVGAHEWFDRRAAQIVAHAGR